ncbi:MAG TPA: GNAT family N-acetyltransferase [Gemmatimonadaceae bacterium]|nr:GNAT family N-acetyltransferase [Gemmatimonadaceae bacterium]
MTTIVVRDARPDDDAAVRALTRRAYAEYATVMDAEAWGALAAAIEDALAGAPGARRLVAERAGTLVGSVLLFPPATNAYGEMADASPWPELRLLAVDPAARGLGVAERLVAACVDAARAMGARELGLHTSSSMRTARRLYERLGFQRAPERDFRPPGAEVVEGFRLRLDPRPPGD